jgi:hypothetical protein
VLLLPPEGSGPLPLVVDCHPGRTDGRVRMSDIPADQRAALLPRGRGAC